MKNIKIKDLLITLLVSIFIAGLLACLFCVGIEFSNQGKLIFENYGFTKMLLGVLAIGLGFDLPTIVYKMEKIPFIFQTIIHMGIGLIVCLAVMYFEGWIPVEEGLIAIIFTILGVSVVSFFIWLCFFLYNRKLARKMNASLEEKRNMK